MLGIDLNGEITLKTASLRFFEPNERHVSRLCPCDVLVLVYDGVLRFSEDGEPCEVSAGEYYIQRRGRYQSGDEVSDSPKYLYIHFVGEWGESGNILPMRGTFNYAALETLINEIDAMFRADYSKTEKDGAVFTLLSLLYRSRLVEDTLAKQVADYLQREYLSVSSLEDICERFHYSKNHIINVFKAEYGMTPFEYLNDVKIKRGMYLLGATSRPIDEISRECGFNNYSHFYRLFVRKNGISPYEWREKVNKIEN